MSVHRFELLFKIEPAGDFGLPVQDTVVVKAVEGKAIYSATLDRTTGNLVSHGVLPVYRDDSEAVHVERESDGLQIRIRDNFLTVQLDGQDYVSVQDSVLSAVDRFVQLLSLTKHVLPSGARPGSPAERKREERCADTKENTADESADV